MWSGRNGAAGAGRDITASVSSRGAVSAISRYSAKTSPASSPSHTTIPEVTAGIVVWDGEDAGDVLALYREIADTAPRELTLAVMSRPAPAAPFLPDHIHG